MSTNPFTLEAFLTWVETKDPEETYHWWNTCNCACAQYAEFLGAARHAFALPLGFGERINFIASLQDPLGIVKPVSTFGALAERLRQEIAA
jgi:hypothetical protein